MGMQSLERTLERMVVGVFSRGARTNIRPIELGRRLVREMDDQRSVDVKGRRVVPNDFVLKLSPKDYAGFTEISDVLQTELVEAAREYARSEGYHFMGPVRVELTEDETQKAGRFDVVATLRQAAAAAPAPAAAPSAAPADAAVPPAPAVATPAATGDEIDWSEAGSGSAIPVESRLILPSGEKVPLGDVVVTVGRLSESTIPLNDQNVSRKHAEIRPNRKNYVVVDLGSTNGTMVNGTRIHGETTLSDGDIISFGSTYVRFEAS
jgi:hypothetical protein